MEEVDEDIPHHRHHYQHLHHASAAKTVNIPQATDAVEAEPEFDSEELTANDLRERRSISGTEHPNFLLWNSTVASVERLWNNQKRRASYMGPYNSDTASGPRHH
ncbi:unnamed protein product [Gongylonema pulchrum]|uniref:Uncharacterized protein n=1 Tax=Gongylonema pulchrum TaxID=637853 RepID=A0A183D5X4_9BILA|nr:unnamed protein product [Gongylonema pulchrum]